MTTLANLLEATVIGSFAGGLLWSWFDVVMSRIEREADDADVR